MKKDIYYEHSRSSFLFISVNDVAVVYHHYRTLLSSCRHFLFLFYKWYHKKWKSIKLGKKNKAVNSSKGRSAGLTIMTISSVINHLVIEIYSDRIRNNRIGRLLIGASHQALHYRRYKNNFGLYFTFWDKWKNTESPLLH
ncbi:MAG TPA: hypothetical protein VM101_00665 [Flavitalea sp.]|nr:hypothetical protein [Flavitalea sp.]